LKEKETKLKAEKGIFQEGLLLKYYSSDERMDAKNQKNQGGIFYEN